MLAIVHLRQTTLHPETRELWQAAMADVGIDPSQALLFTLPGESSSSGFSARHWSRNRYIDAAQEPADLVSAIEQMNQDDCVDAYRVAVWTERSEEGIAALLRREAEHPRQFEMHGRCLLDLYDLAEGVLQEYAGGLAGSALLYQAIPLEFDANAATAVFVRSRYGDDRIDELLRAGDKDSAAFRALVPPPSPDKLPERVVLFLASMPHLCSRFADRQGIRFPRILDLHWSGAGAVWQRLTDDHVAFSQ